MVLRQGRDFDGMLTYLSRLLSPIDRSDYVQPIASQLGNQDKFTYMLLLRSLLPTSFHS